MIRRRKEKLVYCLKGYRVIREKTVIRRKSEMLRNLVREKVDDVDESEMDVAG
jgi:hypothetical protein